MTTEALMTDVTELTGTLGRPRTVRDQVETASLWDPASSIATWGWDRDVRYLFQIWRTSLPIVLSDMMAVGISVALSALIFHLFGNIPGVLNWSHVGCWCVYLGGACVLSGLYPATGINTATEIQMLTRIIVAGVTMCVAYDLFHGGENQYLFLWPLYGVLMLVLVPLSRGLARRAVCDYGWWGLQTIVIGAGDRGLKIMHRMNENPWMGFKPVAIVDQFRQNWMLRDQKLPSEGVCPLEDTPRLSAKYHAYCGIFVGSEFPATERIKMVDTLTSVFPQLYITSDSADAGRHWSGVLEIGNLRLLRVTERLLMPGARWVKRTVDVLAILLVAPLIVPLVLCLALMVKLSSPGPAFYCHPRIGRNGRTIRVWKLRSMILNADSMLKHYLAENPHLQRDWDRLHKLPNDPRVTSIGRFLRKTSLDEIPQLWNVFLGEMSLVGPRPIVQAEIPKYQSVYPLYLRVTPGITGLWQVNGRNSTTYEERISYDAEYVRNWSLCLDIYILARTVQTVVTCDGAC